LVSLPAGFNKLFQSDADWAYFTEPERELGDRRIYWPRGKLIGGSSSMNAMIYIRGIPSDYDGWANLGCTGWSWKEVLPFFRKAERNERGASELHGGDGAIQVSDQRDANAVSRAFIDACVEFGFARNDDFNGAIHEGFGLYQVTQRRGRRFSAADAYLAPARRRKNLHVETGAHVTRLLFDRRRCLGVEYVKNGKTERALATREVLLAGGAINSPQLLLASGIGPASDLRALAIDVVADVAGVGKNLQDHPIVGVYYKCTKPITLDVAEGIPNLLRFLLDGRGPLTSNVAEAGGFWKTRADLEGPDLQLHFAPAWFVAEGSTKPEGCGFSIGPTLIRPESRGEIKLRSVDPSDPPRIFARYLSDRRDLETLVAGVKTMREVAKSKALAQYRGAERLPGESVRTDAEIETYVRGGLETLFHPVGTCKMGTDADAVVDPELRVRGVERVRVIDASIMPRIPSGNTQAPTVMIAERAASLLSSEG
jgi:choline dehydrogenase